MNEVVEKHVYIYIHVVSFLCSPLDTYIQGVSKIYDITSGMSSSHVDNKHSLYQLRFWVSELRLSKTAEKLNFVTPADGFRH
jgi:hypothetical protein